VIATPAAELPEQQAEIPAGVQLPPRGAVLVSCGVLGLILAGYFALTGLHYVSTGSAWVTWTPAAVELVAALLCLQVGFSNRAVRMPAWIMGAALLTWALRDATLKFREEYFHSLSPYVPAGLHLAFYPLVVGGLVFLLREDLKELGVPMWLEMLVVALGSGSVCAVFAFWSVPSLADGLDFMHLGYAVGDVVVAAVVGAYVSLLWERRSIVSIIPAAGIGLVVIGATCSLLPVASGSLLQTVIAPGAWSVAILLLSLAIWLRPQEDEGGRRTTPSLALPNLAALPALAISFVGPLVAFNHAALMLASLTIAGAGLRLFLLLRDTRAISKVSREQAATDELTGLWNRRHIFRVLDTYFAEREAGTTDETLALLFVDLNGFKEVNDSFGHAAGDHLLRLLGSRLSGSLRDSDILARLGGDEFAVVLPGSDMESAVTVAFRLSTCLEHPFQLRRVSASISASIGIAMAPADATDSHGLLQCADAAMYRAKLSDSRLACFEQMVDVERDHMRMLDELRTAIQEDELVLYYQPQLDIRSGSVAGVEALVRWNHPRLGLLAPPAFLPLAEGSGDIREVTRWVLNRAASDCAQWRSKGFELSVSVNVSPSNLLDAELLATVRETLDRHGVPASSIVLEITENWLASNFDTARQAIRKLSDLGVKVSIDDFGAGTTSLAYLRDLAVAELKLDRAFAIAVDGANAERDLGLLRSTIELGHSIGLRIVAEGVETEATLDLLAQLGCDLAQGYHISKPKPPDELAFQAKGKRGAMAA